MKRDDTNPTHPYKVTVVKKGRNWSKKNPGDTKKETFTVPASKAFELMAQYGKDIDKGDRATVISAHSVPK